MKCYNCNSEMPDGAKFCAGCGEPMMQRVEPPVISPRAAQSTAYKGKKTSVIISAIIMAVIVFYFLGNLGMGGFSASQDLSECIGKSGGDIEIWAKMQKLENVSERSYEGEGLVLTLNENGNIDECFIFEDKYTFYGIKVGQDFQVKREGKKLTSNGYMYLSDDDNAVVYGMPYETSGERYIEIFLGGDGKISGISYYTTGGNEEFFEEKVSEDMLGTYSYHDEYTDCEIYLGMSSGTGVPYIEGNGNSEGGYGGYVYGEMQVVDNHTLKYEGEDGLLTATYNNGKITVKSDNNFGGIRFPGFDGVYTKIEGFSGS